MLLIRSIFWLTLAYLVIHPGANLQESATAMTEQAMVKGQQIIADQILSNDCGGIACLTGKAVAAIATAKPSVDLPMQDSPQIPIPEPRPRPDWLG